MKRLCRIAICLAIVVLFLQAPARTSQSYDANVPADEPSYSKPVRLPVLDQPGMSDELITLNFEQTDIRTVLKTIGDITGVNFVIDDSVQGTVTVLSPSKIRLAEVYGVLESILEVKGYAAIPSGNFVKIVPRAEAVKRNLEVRIGADPAGIPENDQLVTQIIPLKFADASEVSQIVKPMLRSDGNLSTYPRTNSVIITDTSANINHIARIIQKLDVAGSQEHVTVIQLKYASAQVISEQIIRIIDKTRSASAQGAPRQTGQIETSVKILPDSRTNSLVVVANVLETRTIDELVKQLDVQQPSNTGNVNVVYLKNATAKETAESLKAALANLRITGAIESTQNIQVTADEGTNALIITASPQDFDTIAQIVEKLDIVREQVLVEMVIMEASEDSLREIGIDWATLDDAVADSIRVFGSTNFGPRIDYLSGDFEGLSVGAWRYSNTNIGAIINALEKESGVNILSTPRITTSNHHKAKIIVGENIRFQIQSGRTSKSTCASVRQRLRRRDFGIDRPNRV